jgi:hypothetical protein
MPAAEPARVCVATGFRTGFGFEIANSGVYQNTLIAAFTAAELRLSSRKRRRFRAVVFSEQKT